MTMLRRTVSADSETIAWLRKAAPKAILLLAAALWHGWAARPGTVFGVLFGVLPYGLLLISASRLRSRLLVGTALLLLCWISWRAGSEVQRSTSAMRGVALIMASAIGCGVVGVAWLVSLFVPKERGGRSSRLQ